MNKMVALFVLAVQLFTASTLIFLIWNKDQESHKVHVDQYQDIRDQCILAERAKNKHFNMRDIEFACADKAEKEILGQ